MCLYIARIDSDEKFTLVFDLSEVTETDRFVSRREELASMHMRLSDNTSRRHTWASC